MSTQFNASQIAASEARHTAIDSSARFSAFAVRLVAAYPILWLIGLAPAFWIVLGVVGGRYLLRRHLRPDVLAILLVPLLLLLSLPIGVTRFGADPGRIVSMTANLLIWIAVAAMVDAVAPHGTRVRRLMRAIVGVGVVQGILIAISARLYPTELPVPLLAPLLANAPGGISAFARNGLYYLDWLNGAAFRSQGIMGNATWNGAFGAITILLGLYGLVCWRGWWRLLALSGVLSGLVSVQTSLSRSTTIALAVAFLAGAWVLLKARRPVLWFWTTAVLVLVVAWGVAFQLDPLLQQLTSINDERAGSAMSRGAIYATTLQYIQESPFPALGYGLKPKDDALVASVATHSTYLGIVFRAGFLGAAVLLLVYLRGGVAAIRRADPVAAALMVFIGLWSLFEDIDGGHLVPLALVLVFAVRPTRGAGRSATASPQDPD